MVTSSIFAVRDILAVQRRENERGSYVQRLLEVDCHACGLSMFKKKDSMHKVDYISTEWFRPNANGNSAAIQRREMDRGEWKEIKTKRGTKKQWKGKIQTVNRVTINNDLRQDRDSHNNERYIQVAMKAARLQESYDKFRVNGNLEKANVIYGMLVRCLCWLERWTGIAASASYDTKKMRHQHNKTIAYSAMSIDRSGMIES